MKYSWLQPWINQPKSSPGTGAGFSYNLVLPKKTKCCDCSDFLGNLVSINSYEESHQLVFIEGEDRTKNTKARVTTTNIPVFVCHYCEDVLHLCDKCNRISTLEEAYDLHAQYHAQVLLV